MSYLPDNYEPPHTGNYMQFNQGENRFRIMGPPTIGNVFWTTKADGGRKPVRRRVNEDIQESELGIDKYGNREKVKHFWAMVIWNYGANQLQVLEITQATIRDAIMVLDSDPDWGDPKDYDLKINKAGAGLETTYNMTPRPKSPPPAEAVKAMAEANPNVDALFDSGDPFDGTAPAAAQQTDEPQSQSRIVEINAAAVVGNWTILDTHIGKLGTDNLELGETLMSFGTGVDIAVVYHITSQGKQVIDTATLAAVNSPGAVDDSDIPWGPHAFDGLVGS